MIFGTHCLLYSRDPMADQAFLRDVLDLRAVALGDDRLALALPPAEVALHPDGVGTPRAVPPIVHSGRALLGAAFYLMCEDLDATLAALAARRRAHGRHRRAVGAADHARAPERGRARAVRADPPARHRAAIVGGAPTVILVPKVCGRRVVASATGAPSPTPGGGAGLWRRVT